MKMIRFSTFWMSIVSAGVVHAHYPWLNVDVAIDETTIEFAWGHHFPNDGRLAMDRVVSVDMIGAGGTHALTRSDRQDAVFTVSAAGLADVKMLVGVQQGSYYSRTPEGGRRGSKRDFPAAMSCSFSNNTAKALVGLGHEAAEAGLPVGHVFELVPLVGAGRLVAGSSLPIKVLFHGEPWQGELVATYAGYDKAAGESDYPVVLNTDEQGRVMVPLDRAGQWLVRANASEPYPDSTLCDRLNYNATLTLTVR